MTKEDLLSGFLYLVMAAIVILVGFLYIRPAFSNDLSGIETGLGFLFLAVSLIIGILLNVILYELGHILGALMGGYTILSANIIGFCFYKVRTEEGKTKFKFRVKSFNGLSGETLIAPKKEKCNPMFFTFMPFILMLLEVVGFVVVLMMVTKTSALSLQVIKYGYAIVITIAGCMVLYNYFPAKLDGINDGYRLVLLSKKVNLEAYNVQLSNLGREYFGEPVEEFKVFDEITDFTAQVNNETATIKYMDGKAEEALEIIDKILENESKISKNTARNIKINKAYIYYLTKPENEATEYIKSLGDEINTYITNCKSLPAVRTYILYIGLVEKSKSEIDFAISKVKKLGDRVTEGTRVKEKKLILDAVKFVEANVSMIKDVNVTKLQ